MIHAHQKNSISSNRVGNIHFLFLDGITMSDNVFIAKPSTKHILTTNLLDPCEGTSIRFELNYNLPVTCEFPTQMASNAENVSIWWCHHVRVKQWSAKLAI